MLDVLFAGAAAALIGVAGGHTLAGRGNRQLALELSALKKHSCELITKDLMNQELQKVRVQGAEATMLAVDEAIRQLEKRQLRELEQRCIERTDALQGQLLDVMSERLGQLTGDLITRDEVASAFAQVAQIEAQKVREQQAEAARAAAQQQRIAEVFGTVRPMTQGLDQQLAGLNEQLNSQLAGLSDQLAAIRRNPAEVGQI